MLPFLIIVSLDSFSTPYPCFPHSFHYLLIPGFNRVGNPVFDNSLFLLIIFFLSVGMININMLFSVIFIPLLNSLFLVLLYSIINQCKINPILLQTVIKVHIYYRDKEFIPLYLISYLPNMRVLSSTMGFSLR